MMFSKRTNWDLQHNRLTQLIKERQADGLPLIDLTESNPTKCGFDYPVNEILTPLNKKANLDYRPEPRGDIQARQAVADHYKDLDLAVNPENIFLTTSTSESYNIVFRLLMDVGDEILVPQPSYPLLDYLAHINDVNIRHYQLRYDDEWHIDIHSLRSSISEKTKAILVIHPNNPTGSYIKKDEYNSLIEIALANNLVIISDEVFSDYSFYEDDRRVKSFAGKDSVLTFTLNGISKMLGLPQMKLGWIVVDGDKIAAKDASARLELITDTFLSVSTPIQNALPDWLNLGTQIKRQIMNRIKHNYEFLSKYTANNTMFRIYKIEGGWNVIIKTLSNDFDEEWSELLVRKDGIITQPGYFYDFERNDCMVISLLVQENLFRKGLEIIDRALEIH
jgi:alanine-synthesizing transaminase